MLLKSSEYVTTALAAVSEAAVCKAAALRNPAAISATSNSTNGAPVWCVLEGPAM